MNLYTFIQPQENVCYFPVCESDLTRPSLVEGALLCLLISQNRYRSSKAP